MNRRNIVLLSTVIISMLLLASCNGDGGQGPVFPGGTQALLFTFLDGTPPAMVYDNSQSDFEIILQVKNAGDFDIDKIHFTISGINQRDFPGTYKLPQGMTGVVTKGPELGRDGLAGRTQLEKNVIDGDTAFITLAEKVKYSRQLLGGGELDYEIFVDACYPYATVATSTICLHRDYLDGNDNVCSPKSGGQVSVSGSPLQITSFTQTAVGRDRLRVQYEFQLKSNTEIWAPKESQTCDPILRGDRIRESGVFYVEVDDQNAATYVNCIGFRDLSSEYNGYHIKNINQPMLGGVTGQSILVSHINARQTGFLKLVDGKATLTCTLTFEPQDRPTSNSLGTINIFTGYYLKDSVRKAFSVTHSGTTSSGGSTDTRSAYQICYDNCLSEGTAGPQCATNCAGQSRTVTPPSGGTIPTSCTALEVYIDEMCASGPNPDCQAALNQYLTAGCEGR